MNSSAMLRQEEPAELPAPVAEQPAASAAVEPRRTFGALAARWFRLNKDRLQAVAIGAISLLVFLLCCALFKRLPPR